jgi:hypothetical protein
MVGGGQRRTVGGGNLKKKALSAWRHMLALTRTTHTQYTLKKFDSSCRYTTSSSLFTFYRFTVITHVLFL